jgi:hypothetical protein
MRFLSAVAAIFNLNRPRHRRQPLDSNAPRHAGSLSTRNQPLEPAHQISDRNRCPEAQHSTAEYGRYCTQ